jgi:hypothetical protein
MTQPSSQSDTGVRGRLAEAIVGLAGTPDDSSGIDVQLTTIVRLAADRVAAADYASVTALRGVVYTTVAASSELAVAVDRAQYADRDGPCLQSLVTDTPVTVSDVSDVSTTMRWPGFRQAAAGLGLHASVSIPLFAGGGAAIAALNLYGRDSVAMAPLIVGVWSIYDPDRPLPAGHNDLQSLDPGGEELLAGFAEAVTVRDTIQLAVGVIMGREHITAREAYLRLRLHAADTGVSLPAAAASVITTAA